MIDRRIGKIKVRRGKEIERKPLIFEEGELIYSIDKQRLFIGDGVLPGGILVSNRNYVLVSLGVTTKVIPSTGVYGDIIHETSTNRTYIIGYESDNVTLKLILLADGNCCINLQNEIDDLYARLRPLTACLNSQGPSTPPPPPPATFAWSIQPDSVAGNVGESVTLHARAYGPSSIVYQWTNLSTGDILGAVGEYYAIPSLSLSNIGNYTCKATSSLGTIVSNPASITVAGNSILAETSEYILTENGDYIDWEVSVNVSPKITTQPITQSTVALTNKIFTVNATGTLPLTYQWRINGVDISGETNNTYTAQSPTLDILGLTCKVSNIAGEVISNSVNLTVGSLPAITKQPTGSTVSKGTKITLDVDATGSSPLTYQWMRNGSAITGANSDTYVINSGSVTDSGTYKCVVSNPFGSATSSEVSVVVNNSFDAGDIIIAADVVDFSLKKALINKGWDQVLPVIVTVTVNSGIKVGSSSTATAAFNVESLPSGSTVKLINNGYIVGAGGVGGGDVTNGGNGGNALNLLSDITIINNETIGGGGGGGGGTGLNQRGQPARASFGGGGGAGHIVGKGGVQQAQSGNYGTANIAKSGQLLLGGSGGLAIGSTHGGSGGALGKNGFTAVNEFNSPVGTGGQAGYSITGVTYVTWITKGSILGPMQ